jgi:sugar phosphate isomerase/epimerase
VKFSFSSNAFVKHSLLEAIRAIAAAGYEGIEIMADVPHAFPLHLTVRDIRDMRTALSDHGLAVSNINAFMHCADGDTYHPSWIESDPEQRARRLDHTLRSIDLAVQLGATNISTEPGGPLEGMSREEGLRLYREGLHAVEETARQGGIKVLIEPEPGLLIENSEQFLELFASLDSEVFGINFDVGHFFCVGEDPSELIPKMMPAIHHFHLEDIAASRVHHHLMLGMGAIDIPNVLNTILETGYDGYVTVELYTYDHAPAETAQEAFRYVQNWRRNLSK